MTSCKKDPADPSQVKSAVSDVARYDAKISIDWMNLLRTITRNQNINPPRASRIFAYAGITMYESVFEGIKNYKTLQGQLNGFNLNSIPSNSDSLDYGIVLNEAIFLITKCDTIVPSLAVVNKDSANALHDRFLASKMDVEDSIITKSRERGRIVANAIMQYAASDNFLMVKTMNYIVPMDSSAQFEIPQSIMFSEDTTTAFGRQAREVYNTVNNRTTEQSDIRLWWADPTGTQTPAGHWIGIMQFVIHKQNLKLDKAVELYAMLGIATADAFISCWDAKYKYNLLRPETYIKAYINSSWSTGQLDITPPFPEYPSGHSVCSGAAAEILTDILGNIPFTDSINVEYYNYIPRSFASFNAAAQEAGISRLYGGIHFREAIENGLLQGKNLSQHLKARVQLK